MKMNGKQSQTVINSGRDQIPNGKSLFKAGSMEGLNRSRINLMNQTQSQLRTFDATPQYFAGAQPSLIMHNYSTESLEKAQPNSNVTPLLSPLQSSRAVMANKLKPVKIS